MILDLRALQQEDALRGVGSYARALARHLEPMTVLTWGGMPSPAEAERHRVVTVQRHRNTGHLGWAWAGARGSFDARRMLTDGLHVPTLDASLGLPGPKVVTVHDAIPWRFPHLYPARGIGALRRRAEIGIARGARIVITPSEASARDIERFLGVRAEHIRLIPYAADPGWPSSPVPLPPERMRQLGLPERYIVMAGGFVHRDPRKRYEDPLLCLPDLPPDIGLVVTGADGPHSPAFLRRAAELGVGHRVRLTGHLATNELAAVFTGAELFVFPSLWEGFGLPLANAFRAGVPAVVSDGGALPEVAGGAAVLYPAGNVAALKDALRSLLDDDHLCRDLRARGHQRAELFTWERSAADHELAYSAA